MGGGFFDFRNLPIGTSGQPRGGPALGPWDRLSRMPHLMVRFSISLRGLLAFAAVAALMAAFAASAGAAPLVYMLNGGTKSVSTLDAATNKVVGTAIPTGEDPESIAITPNGKRAFVVNFVGNSVTVIETASRAPVATLPLPSNGERIAISPDGKTAYATSESKEKVVVINTETATETGTITVGPEASALAFAPNGKQAYVGIGPEDVQVVETATGKLVGGPIKVAGFVRQIAFAPNGETAYVAAGNGVAVINTALGMVTGEIPVPSVSTLAVSPDGKRVYAASKSGKSVTVAETGTNKVVGSPIPLPSEPVEIAITPDGGTAYVADGLQVTPINLATDKAATPLSLSGVFHLVVAPDQSPTASFTSPAAFVGLPAAFSGAGSTDPDGSVAAWNWSFGDGATASGVSATHTYGFAGTYSASLSVTDNEGCGEAEVFTGRTAYLRRQPAGEGDPSGGSEGAAGRLQQPLPLRRHRPQPPQRHGPGAGEGARGRVDLPLRQEDPRGEAQSEGEGVAVPHPARAGRGEQAAEEGPPHGGPLPDHLLSRRGLLADHRASLGRPAAQAGEEAPPPLTAGGRAPMLVVGPPQRGERDGHLRNSAPQRLAVARRSTGGRGSLEPGR